MTLDNHNGVITHLEPGILESKDKWALGSITINKPCGDDVIPAELFQILIDGAVKILHSICQQIWKTQQWPRTGKGQFSFQPQRKAMRRMLKLMTIALISHASKVMLKILQARLQRYVSGELPDVQAEFKKAEEPEIKLPTSVGSS